MKFKNVSTLGALEVPALGRVVEAGESFEVDASLGLAFAGNGNFEPIDKTAKDAAVEYADLNAAPAERAELDEDEHAPAESDADETKGDTR